MSNTHLNGGGPNSEAARRLQITALLGFVNKYVEEQKEEKNVSITSVIQCGDYNIGPCRKEDGSPDPEWKAEFNYFGVVNGNYIREDQQTQGSTFNFDQLDVGWNMKQVDSWPLTHERVDQILSYIQPPAPPSGSFSVDVSSSPPRFEVPQGELFLDRMHGCSDHAAVRGILTWTTQQKPTPGIEPESTA